MPRIPLIEGLTKGPVPVGSNLLVEFDSASQWYNASLTVGTEWIRTGGRVSYNVSTQPPDNIRSQLKQLTLNVDELERDEKLFLYDWYTLTLGVQSKERYAAPSLKAADVSVVSVTPRTSPEEISAAGYAPDLLIIWDDASFLDRFNDTKSWMELLITRFMARTHMTKSSFLFGLAKGVLGEWVYRRLEIASDGIIEFKLDETVDPPQNLIRLRSLRNVSFDGRWHPLRISENFEVTLEK